MTTPLVCNCKFDYLCFEWVLKKVYCGKCKKKGIPCCKQYTIEQKIKIIKRMMYKHHHCKICKLCDCDWDMKLKTAQQGCYMIKDSVWLFKASRGTVLCEICFEKRLGRSLIPSDYSTAPVNNIHGERFKNIVNKQKELKN